MTYVYCNPDDSIKRAFVAFSKEADWFPLRILNKFKHCFLLIDNGKNWLAFEPLLHRTNIFVLDTPIDIDLPEWLRKQGLDVIPALVNKDPNRNGFFSIMTCVSQIKRVLGIKNIFVQTPNQLYKFLSEITHDPRKG